MIKKFFSLLFDITRLNFFKQTSGKDLSQLSTAGLGQLGEEQAVKFLKKKALKSYPSAIR